MRRNYKKRNLIERKWNEHFIQKKLLCLKWNTNERKKHRQELYLLGKMVKFLKWCCWWWCRCSLPVLLMLPTPPPSLKLLRRPIRHSQYACTAHLIDSPSIAIWCCRSRAARNICKSFCCRDKLVVRAVSGTQSILVLLQHCILPVLRIRSITTFFLTLLAWHVSFVTVEMLQVNSAFLAANLLSTMKASSVQFLPEKTTIRKMLAIEHTHVRWSETLNSVVTKSYYDL